ncbi:hypothetical protein T484DRAFT_1810966 [Baffinella frigidus]|nr:hypothetical protein T484DRAFT_1810966 [Cryptophyta sp. CCMP2293]
MLLDTCGGHASPYHYHEDDPIGVALDGYVIYGMYEGASGAKPTRDACNGHTGSVPANSTYGTTSSEVYHYRTTGLVPPLILVL